MSTRKARSIKWDEPKGCTTPRGWCYIDGLSLTYDGQKPVGYYLTYPPSSYAGGNVLASAYIFRDMPHGYGTGPTRHARFKTVAAAKRWVERTAPHLTNQRKETKQ
jgi:hypothetical protein